jgi:hypothetical protein
MNQMVSIYQQKFPNYDLTRQLVNKVNATRRIAIRAIKDGYTWGNVCDLKEDINKDILLFLCETKRKRSSSGRHG